MCGYRRRADLRLLQLLRQQLQLQLQLHRLQQLRPPRHQHHQLRGLPGLHQRQELGRRRELVPHPGRDRRGDVALPVGLIGVNSRQDYCSGLGKRAGAAIRDDESEIRNRVRLTAPNTPTTPML